MLRVKNLSASVGGDEGEKVTILKGVDIDIKPGEIHAVMGQNGSGKSSFSRVLAGHPDYEIEDGSIELEINGQMKNLADFLANYLGNLLFVALLFLESLILSQKYLFHLHNFAELPMYHLFHHR